MIKAFKKGLSKGAIGILFALVCLLPTAQATLSYLLTIGPPPLRFSEVSTNDFNYSRFKAEIAEAALAAAKIATTSNQLTAAASRNKHDSATPSEPGSNDQRMTESEPKPEMPSQESSGDGEKPPTPRPNFSFPSSTASDLLSVTPQMIAQYLKPDPNATNTLDRPGAVVFVPADLPFTPPTPQANPESKANYHSP